MRRVDFAYFFGLFGGRFIIIFIKAVDVVSRVKCANVGVESCNNIKGKRANIANQSQIWIAQFSLQLFAKALGCGELR